MDSIKWPIFVLLVAMGLHACPQRPNMIYAAGFRQIRYFE